MVVVINRLKYQKMKKMLPYEMKFLVPNYSCLQNPWLGGYRPQIPVLPVLCPQLNFLNPPEQNSWVRHWLRVNELLSLLKLHCQGKRKRINFPTPLSPLHTFPPCPHLCKKWTVMHFSPHLAVSIRLQSERCVFFASRHWDVGRSRGTGPHIINLDFRVFRITPRLLSPEEWVSATHWWRELVRCTDWDFATHCLALST